MKPKYSQEIVDLAVELVEVGHSNIYIRSLLNEEFGIKISNVMLDKWFRRKRESFFKPDYKFQTNYEDAMKFKEKVESLRQQVKAGLILIYLGEVPGSNNKPLIREKHSVIRGVYKNFVLTEDGAIQFSDIKGVINFGQVKEKESVSSTSQIPTTTCK